MKKLISLAIFWVWSFAFCLPSLASSSCTISDVTNSSEIEKACNDLWKSVSILESLVPLFEKKDVKVQNNVRNLLEEFKKSSDPYTRNIGLYFWYLVDKSSSTKQEEKKDSDATETDKKDQEKESSSEKKEESSSSSSSSEIEPVQITVSSSVVKDGWNAELLSLPLNVKYGSYWVKDIIYTVQWLNNTHVILEIDGSSVDSTTVEGNTISFTDLNETLAVWKHIITLRADLDAEVHIQEIKMNKFILNNSYWSQLTKNLDLVKLVARAYPTLTSSTSSDDLILTVNIPDEMEDDVEILWFLVDWYAITAAFNEQVVDLSAGTSLKDLISEKGVTLRAWDSTEFRIQAVWNDTLRVKWIIFKVDERTYVVNDRFLNVWKWVEFKVTSHSWGLPASNYKLVSSSDDTTIIPSN